MTIQYELMIVDNDIQSMRCKSQFSYFGPFFVFESHFRVSYRTVIYVLKLENFK